MKAILLLALALAAASCSDLVVPSARTLDGGWDRVEIIPGSREHWDVTVTGTSISGSGDWTGEACCSGTLSIAGRISGDSVHIAVTHVTTGGAVTQTPPWLYYFDGVMESSDLLVGKDAQYRKSK
jgi:hypothetical protein